MNITEKAAYLKGLADGLGIDPQSKEGRLWAALNDLLGDMAHELARLEEVDRSQADALEGVADEMSYLEELCGGFDSDDEELPPPPPPRGCCGMRGGCPPIDSFAYEADEADEEAEAEEEEEDEELSYDGVIYDATCPVCGEEISFDEETLERGSIQCPNCGETLEFDLGEGDEDADESDSDELSF